MLKIDNLIKIYTDTGETYNNVNISYENMLAIVNDEHTKPDSFIEITDRKGHKAAIMKSHITSFCEQFEV